MHLLAALLLAASVDGEAALRHASALAALGPHPWGSPRNQAAARYVAAELREAGLTQVVLEGFERHGIRGTNVVGTLPGPNEEMLVIGAHHDTAPGAPGAYDDGGGVGLLIELARVLVAEPSRNRTVVFVSFDGEEAWSTGRGTTAGSRAWIERLGPDARRLAAAFIIEMAGWDGGTPVVHPIAYANPRATGRPAIVPAWLVRSTLEGSRSGGARFGVGDPWLSWLYQPAVRTFRAQLYGDDLSFVQAGLPAIFASDSSFTAFYPHYHQPSDTAEKLDPAALERMGTAVLGALRAIDDAPRGAAREPTWFAASGFVLGPSTLLLVAVASVLPGFRVGLAAGGPALVARLAQAALFAVLYWRHPVPALWLFLLPNVLLPLGRARWATLLALAPAAALVALGAAAWYRGMVGGVWLAPWEIVVAILALVLAFVRPAKLKRMKKKGKKRRR
jgi:hypothetical protein